MKELLKIIGREELLFKQDIKEKNEELTYIVENSKFLVLGGAGSIEQAVAKEIIISIIKEEMLFL